MLVSCTLFIRKYANNPESRFSRLANNAQRIMSVAGLDLFKFWFRHTCTNYKTHFEFKAITIECISCGRSNIYVCVCMHVCMCVCVCVYVCMYIYIYIYLCVYVYVFI